MMQANLVSWKRSDVLRCQLSNSAKSTLDDMECNVDISKQPALLLILTKFIVCFESYKNTQEASQLHMIKKVRKWPHVLKFRGCTFLCMTENQFIIALFQPIYIISYIL